MKLLNGDHNLLIATPDAIIGYQIGWHNDSYGFLKIYTHGKKFRVKTKEVEEAVRKNLCN